MGVGVPVGDGQVGDGGVGTVLYVRSGALQVTVSHGSGSPVRAGRPVARLTPPQATSVALTAPATTDRIVARIVLPPRVPVGAINLASNVNARGSCDWVRVDSATGAAVR
ncbi:hypothetical protein Pen02_53240 [Plantactinospora endophytica]|uniref:Peptidase M23 domain-containing protein n=1 Tax=Plantactinospora endophytica TaxID=673535 RepID=A0ABQ4E6P3_9ACTN|nr:hypothetical protein Pen02_53240 [Plantactinospora endophytica]